MDKLRKDIRGLVKQRVAELERRLEAGGLVKRLAQSEQPAELVELAKLGLVTKRVKEFERRLKAGGLVKRVAQSERPAELRELAKRRLVSQRLDKIRKSQGLKP